MIVSYGRINMVNEHSGGRQVLIETFLDSIFGQEIFVCINLMAALEREGLLDTYHIIIQSDHGGDYKTICSFLAPFYSGTTYLSTSGSYKYGTYYGGPWFSIPLMGSILNFMALKVWPRPS